MEEEWVNSDLYNSIVSGIYLGHLCKQMQIYPINMVKVLSSFTKGLIDAGNKKQKVYNYDLIMKMVSDPNFTPSDEQLTVCKTILDEFRKTISRFGEIDILYLNFADDVMNEHTKRIRNIKIEKLGL